MLSKVFFDKRASLKKIRLKIMKFVEKFWGVTPKDKDLGLDKPYQSNDILRSKIRFGVKKLFIFIRLLFFLVAPLGVIPRW